MEEPELPRDPTCICVEGKERVSDSYEGSARFNIDAIDEIAELIWTVLLRY